MYLTLLLPLSVANTYTYVLPSALEDRVSVGSRVIAQFGAKRYYTSIVLAIHPNNPQPDIQLKPITDVVDDAPIVLPSQLKLWQWIAQYYMCTQGEVMRAALPTGLKLESETLLVRNDDFDIDSVQLSERELHLYNALNDEKGHKLLSLEKDLGERNLMRPAKRLIDLGAIAVRETITESFKPRKQAFVRLTTDFQTEEALHQVLDSLKRAKAQEALLLRYLDLSKSTMAITLQNAQLLQPVSRHDLCQEPNAATALTALRKRGILEVYEEEQSRLHSIDERSEGPSLVKPLSTEQQRAHDEILSAFESKNVCLLHGVTSSGKTEVYIQLIREVLAQGKQVLYLVPEIALTTQLTNRLGRVFGSKMGIYHSKFPDAERVELWQRQLSDKPYPLILGVRSSVFLPFQNLGLIIVDEEHETSYKQQDPAPRYQARDTAIVMATQLGAKVLLGTATPAIESYHNALTGKYGLVKMLHRFGDVQLPEIVVADVKELQRKKLMKTPFSPELTNEVHTALAQGEQAILFQNRRGYSPVLMCKACGWTPRCTRCDVTLTYHQRLNKLVCHYCGAQYNVPKLCPNCEEPNLRDMGYGTEKIESAAESIFAEAKAERMDLDTTRTRSAYERIINRFSQGRTNLLIGTQMVTKGLDFDRVRVVGILNADQILNMPDFRAYERAYQMLSQVAGRAGRRGKRGKVILQTRQVDNPIIGQIVRNDYEAMYQSQLEERQLFHFPPFYRLITIYLKHRNDDVVDHAAQHLAALLRPYFKDDLLGPDRPVVSRVQLLYIRKIMVKIAPQFTPSSVRQTLFSARDIVQHFDVYKSVNIYFDVD